MGIEDHELLHQIIADWTDRMRRRADEHGHRVRLVRRSIKDLHTEIEPLILRRMPVPIALLCLARLLVERIDCQLACLMDEEAITAPDWSLSFIEPSFGS